MTQNTAFRPLRVYLSSTFADLEPFRDAVIDRLSKMNDPGRERVLLFNMEAYSADARPPMEKCLADVAACDVYVGLFAWRYGFVPPGQDKSITELEYRTARRRNLPCLIFLADEEADLSGKHIDKGKAAERILELREELGLQHIIERPLFRAPDQLASQVVTALFKLDLPRAEATILAAIEPPDHWLRPFLEWVVRVHSTLELAGLQKGTRVPVKLEQVYVALRGDCAGAFELAQSRDLLNLEVEEMPEAGRAPSPAEKRRLRARLLRQHPLMLSLLERDRPDQTDPLIGRNSGTVTLGEAFRRERCLVILGDPGSGKTTLCRWLALKLAASLLADPDGRPVLVPAFQVNPDTPYDSRPLQIGPARLPILVRVSEYAQALAKARQDGLSLPLVEWLAGISWNRHPPTAAGDRIPPPALDRLFRQFLRQGQAVVLLDGLDEITEAIDRAEVVGAIERFVAEFIPMAGSPGTPVEVGGNQLVVTSRIAGYHAAPLATTVITHVTIEPMRRAAVEHFCDVWMREVHRELFGDATESQARAHIAAEGLKRAVFDPEHPGVEEIASNPLLVTILASLYLSHRHKLPRSRAELYQAAIELLISGWRTTRLNLDETLFVLDPLAAHIHEHYPTGLIEEAELIAIVTAQLALWRGWPTDNAPPRLHGDVREFVDVLREQVGLIAARGEQLYGFLHLTFQEYLAARHLTRHPTTTAAAMLAHMSDPRWREPILLALGYVAWKWPPRQREQLLQTLLAADDPLDVVLPQAPLLLAEAVAEMPTFPEGPFGQMIRRLLAAYSDRTIHNRFPILCQRIESAFLQLRRSGNAAWLDAALAETIAAPGAPNLASAAATLVRQHGWFTPTVVEALAQSMDNDSAAWNWPIEASLRDLTSPDFPEEEPPRPTPSDHQIRELIVKLRKLDGGELLTETEAELAASTAILPTLHQQLRDAEAALVESRQQLARARVTQGADITGAEKAMREREKERDQVAKRLRGHEQLVSRVDDLRADGHAARAELLERIDKEKATLESTQKDNPREQERKARWYGVAVAARARWELNRNQRVWAELPTADLEVRAALQHEPALLARVRGECRWLTLLTALYGGYPNCRAEQTDGEYRQLAKFLQRSNAEREAIIEANPDLYVGRFGSDDPVYAMAVYLDNKMGGRMKAAQAPPEFDPRAMYRNSLLNREVLALLRRQAPRDEAVLALRRAWHNQSSPRAQADAVAGLVALGVDVIPELSAALNDPAGRAASDAILGNLARLARFLRDPVYRGRNTILEDLKNLAEPNGHTWVAVAETALRALVLAADVPLDFTSLVDHAPTGYRPALRADAWYCAFNANEDRVYATAVVLDTIPVTDQLVPLLVSAHDAPNRRWGQFPFPWEVEPIPPRLADGPHDISVEAFSNLTNLHLGDIRDEFELAMYDAALKRLVARTATNPNLRPELAAFALRLGAVGVALQCLPQLGSRVNILDTLAKAARSVPDPYHQGRALVALATLLDPAARQALLQEVRNAAARVQDSFQQTQLREILIPQGSESDRADLTAEAVAAAATIRGPEQRCRALARLTRWAPGGQRAALWRAILDAAAAIADEQDRADTLRLLVPLLSEDDGAVRARWNAVVNALSTPLARARAGNRLGLHLLREPPPSLAARIAEHREVWAPVLLAAAIHDVLFALQQGPSARRAWSALAAQPGDPQALADLLDRGEENGLPLTHEAARAIEVLLGGGANETLEMLLPLLQTPTPEARPLVARWQHSTHRLLALHANLMLAEEGRQIEQPLPGLLALLADGPDRSRYRAELVLKSRVWSVEKANPQMSTARLGARVFETIARETVRAEDSDVHVASALIGMTADFLHDDPEAIQRWALRLSQNGSGDRETATILSSILALSEQAWPVFLGALEQAPRPVRLVLLQSLHGMIYAKGRLPKKQLAPVLQTLRRLNPAEFCDQQVVLEPEMLVATVAHEITGRRVGDPRAIVATADECLRAETPSLGDVLAIADDERLVEVMKTIGRSQFRMLDGSHPEAVQAATIMIERPEAFPVLLHWLTAVLTRGERDSPWSQKLTALLAVTAEATKRMPAAFARLAEPVQLERPLIRVVRQNGSAVARRAAVVLLGQLRRVAPQTIEAFLFALRDDRHVQEAAIGAIAQLKHVSGAILPPLEKALSDLSAVTVYGATRMLAALGSKERTGAEQRRHILVTLSQQVRARRSQRAVYRYTGLGAGENDTIRITPFGRLDQAFTRAILEIGGVVGPL